MEETLPIRDYAMYATVFGMFAFAWFGWAQEKPPKNWPIFLGIGSVVSLIVAGLGAYLAVRHWDSASSLAASGDYMKFGIVVATEIASMLVGSLVLTLMGKSSYISLWISFVVAVHFVPLAILFRDHWLYLLGGMMVVAQALAFWLSSTKNIMLSALVGLMSGVILLCFALRGLVLFWLAR